MGARPQNESVMFYYFDEHQPAEGTFPLPDGKTYTAEYIDTLELTRTPLPGEYSGNADGQVARHAVGLSLVPPKGLGVSHVSTAARIFSTRTARATAGHAA